MSEYIKAYRSHPIATLDSIDVERPAIGNLILSCIFRLRCEEYHVH